MCSFPCKHLGHCQKLCEQEKNLNSTLLHLCVMAQTEIDDSHLSVRFRHGVHTIYLFVDSQAPFSHISSELASILHERYPRGLTTSLEPPTTTVIPAQPKFVYGLLNKHDDPSHGWKRINVGPDEGFAPTKCGLKNNSLVAFMVQDDGDDPDDVVFQVEWPTEDEELYEQEL
ncbi:hypothetical protein CCM_02844 [Cordyceps militaris CM01]|uniref:Uncharacterized protein n=1 Tax=Cordyceps militaris (strain CM01) TaxID=983644 RepID=G3JC58_CORMM|nr:uncharacterized protein CCM_02844 [Cordyceps militaris CM01]EGX94573.1 hypothetical protein CCM_02844 [Cordyceps militaris CM01]